jgi:CPA2 family monovalent cation:H+ antiporter-2
VVTVDTPASLHSVDGHHEPRASFVRLLELGAVILGLAGLARIAARFDLPTVPLYLLAGLAFGEGGILPLVTTRGFVETGAEIGLILVLFVLGLEHSSRDLLATARSSTIPGVVDLVLNATPGALAGLLLGWGPLAAAFLGGITYVSSSGVAAKLLEHAGPHARGASRFVVTLAVIEDLVMAIYLPVLAALLIGAGAEISLAAAGIAIVAVALLLVLALRVEVGLSQMLFSRSDEALLLSILGFAIVIAGVAEVARFSAAVGALLAGIMLSGPAAEGAQTLVRPLRDLFAAIFFAFIGLSVDPSTIPPVLGIAVLLGLATSATKYATGWWAARRLGSEPLARGVVGAALIPRGEFSIAIAGLAAAATVEKDLGALTVAYVVLTVIVGSVVTKVLARRVDRWEPSDAAARHG